MRTLNKRDAWNKTDWEWCESLHKKSDRATTSAVAPDGTDRKDFHAPLCSLEAGMPKKQQCGELSLSDHGILYFFAMCFFIFLCLFKTDSKNQNHTMHIPTHTVLTVSVV